MPLTEELSQQAKAILLPLGFQDTREAHPWNILSMERDFGPLGELTIWGRDWSNFMLNWSQTDEQMVQIIDTLDLAELHRVVVLTIEYLSALG